MCRCCQSLLESCYWHVYARWRFDEEIALYEEGGDKGARPQHDNPAFWDTVSAIASRSAIVSRPPSPSPRVAVRAAPAAAAARDRKKSLKERRKSRADLTLDLSRRDGFGDFHELPIIRQGSVPKFYDSYTPDVNPFAGSGSGSVSALTSPVLAASDAPRFDLRSVVQLELETQQQQTSPAAPNTRLANIRRKMAPILVKKPSARSMPNIHT